MNDLSPEDRAFLDLARGADDPSNGERERVRGRLAAKLGIAAATLSASKAASAAASTTHAASAGSATLLATSGTFVAKVVAVVALSAGAGGVLLYRTAEGPTRPRVSSGTTTSAHAVAPLVSATRAGTRITIPPPPAAQTPPIETVAAPVAVLQPPATSAAPRPAPGSSRTVATATLEDETRLVQSAIAALRSGDPSSALTLLDEHAHEFPRGMLAEERAAERVFALCALGREAEARAAGDRFLLDHPNAPLAGKVRASCAGDGLDRR